MSTLYAVYHPLKTVVPRFVDFYFSNDLRLNKFLKPLVNIGAKHDMGAVSTLYLCFRVKDDIVLSDLAKWYFESSQWHRGVNEICAEGARNHGLLNVPTDGFFNTVHTLPSDPEEQLAIASYLSLFQARLDSAQAVLEKLLRIRSGLMQRLFT